MASKYSEKQIQEMLAGLSVETLNKVASEKAMAGIADDVAQYTTTAKAQRELKKKIQTINPNWKPPTLGDGIIDFLADKGEVQTKGQIQTEFGEDTNIGLALSHIVKNGRVTDTNGKYSVTVAAKK